MIANFKYKGNEIKIQFKNEETAQEVCNRFANKAIINIDDFYFKYGEKVLDLDFPLLSQLNLKEETKEIEILVIKNDPEKEHILALNIDGAKEKVVIKKGQSIYDSILSKLKFLKKPLKKLGFIYGGKFYGENERRKTFHQIANSIDKENNSLNIITYEMDDAEGDGTIQENGNNLRDKIVTRNEEKGEEDDDEDHVPLANSSKFFVKLYSFLLAQFILIGILTFLGFYYNFDDYFSYSSKAFWWTVSVISVFSLISSTVPICLADKGKAGCCSYFLMIVYIPIITIYCYLLKRHDGNDFVEGFYIIYQIIIFGVDCLFLVIFNLIFKRYRGWLHFLILSAVNVLTIYIYVGPLSNNYDNLIMSHDGFVAISVISSVMIAFIIMFNSQIVGINKEENETCYSVIGAISFNSVPFAVALLLIIMVLVIGLLLGILFLFLGLVLAAFSVVVAVYLIILFIGGLI